MERKETKKDIGMFKRWIKFYKWALKKRFGEKVEEKGESGKKKKK